LGLAKYKIRAQKKGIVHNRPIEKKIEKELEVIFKFSVTH
jgi:hypothetical protein